jgi:sec-independent protein translocase protein TatC
MFILAAVITPTGDAFNMCLVAIPMLLLYEVSIWVSALARKRGVVSYPVNAQS